MKIIKINLHKIVIAPRIRTRIELHTNYDKLIISIKRFGLINPIIINQDNVLIDGLRRLTVFHELRLNDIDYNEIPAMVMETKDLKELNRIQRDLNETQVTLFGFEKKEFFKRGNTNGTEF